jgi:hypothetical protein
MVEQQHHSFPSDLERHYMFVQASCCIDHLGSPAHKNPYLSMGNMDNIRKLGSSGISMIARQD